MQVAYGDLCEKNFLVSFFPNMLPHLVTIHWIVVGGEKALSYPWIKAANKQKRGILTRVKIEAKHMYEKHIS